MAGDKHKWQGINTHSKWLEPLSRGVDPDWQGDKRPTCQGGIVTDTCPFHNTEEIDVTHFIRIPCDTCWIIIVLCDVFSCQVLVYYLHAYHCVNVNAYRR